ncbi:MAG: hypothetical protein RL685_2550 [Pseudomonadota bacterium]
MRFSLFSSLVWQRLAVPTRRRASGPLQALSLLTVLLFGIGCAKQAEGERCDQNNGALDCEVGLACIGEEQLSITGTRVALCCPIPPTLPTVDACRASTEFPEEPVTPVVDAGGQVPVTTPTPDAGNSPVTPDAGQDNVGLVDSGT